MNQKEYIYKTAKETIFNKDNPTFSMRTIAKKCDVGIGTVYKYYGNKSDILLDIIKEFWLSYVTEIKEQHNTSKTFTETIKTYYNTLLKYSIEFNYNMLVNELTSSKLKRGKELHQHHQVHFIDIIHNEMTLKQITTNIPYESLSAFIADYLVMTVKTNNQQYDQFELVLNELICE